MEYVEGGTLAQWREEHRATAHEVLVLIDKVLEALAYMHAQGIFHRDLKPGNILVAKGGKRPVVVDYGVAHFPMPAAPQLTDTVLPPGTPRYTSPEALRFEAQNRRNRQARYEYTVKDELYALGVTLYDLLTDPQPASHPQPVPLGFGVMPTPPAHEVNERVPVPLSSFTAKLLALEPSQRPVSAEAARRDVAEMIQFLSEEWVKRPLHPPPQLPPEVPPAAPIPEVPVVPVPGGATASDRAPATSSSAGGQRRWPWARAVAVGAVALGALLACGVYLALRTSTPPASANAELSAAPPAPAPPANPPLPQPPPEQPVSTPEKGTPVNTRNVPEAAAPSPCSLKQPPPRATGSWLAWCKCAGIAGTVVALQAGCPAVQVRQAPTAECSKESAEAMKLLDVDFDYKVIIVQPDVTFPGEDCEGDDGPCIHVGPRTSVVKKGSGKLVRGTLLSGHVFTHANDSLLLVFRWTEATLPNGDKHPVCVEGSQDAQVRCPDGQPGNVCAAFNVDIVTQWNRKIKP
jgi:serine/threonine-protein kinase